MKVESIKECRICSNRSLIPIIDLGEHALSGRFPSKEEQDPPKAPLSLVRCDDLNNPSACGLLQLEHTVSPEELYMHHYGYRSGLNKTMTTHLQNLVKEIESRLDLKDGDVVLDIGSNDATLLKAFANKNISKIGIDPTGKQFIQYYTEDIKLVPDFFNLENFKKSSSKKAKVITSISMFYDLPAPLEFVKDVKESLDEEGIWVLEQSYMPLMLEKNSFDTICHEHLEYYALRQIDWMAKKIGLRILDVSFNDINGGSFRVTVCHDKSTHKSNQAFIDTVLQREEKMGLSTLKPYNEFKNRVEDVKHSLVDFLKEKKSRGHSIHVYGASTKGNTLLQYLGLDSSLIEAAAERNPEKFGRRTPSTNIPIISEEDSRMKNPDYFIVLPWHFKEEFLQREKDYLKKGGKFIFPLPKFEVVGIEHL